MGTVKRGVHDFVLTAVVTLTNNIAKSRMLVLTIGYHWLLIGQHLKILIIIIIWVHSFIGPLNLATDFFYPGTVFKVF